MFKKIIITGLIIFPSLTFASTYGSNFLTGGTCTANNEAGGVCTNAFDANTATKWHTGPDGNNSWIAYDLTSGITNTAYKIELYAYTDVGGKGLKTFHLQGSNDNWTTSSTIYTGITSNTTSPAWEYFTFTPTSTTAYRYWRLIQANDTWRSDGYTAIYELQLKTCTDCSVATSTASSTITTNTGNFMSPELDQLLIYILEGLVIVAVAWGAYKFYKS